MEDAVQHEAERITGNRNRWTKLTAWLTRLSGSGAAITLLLVSLTVWLVVGFALHFNRTWELCMTVGEPPLALALLIVIQHTQNHDNRAMQLKLDELIRALEPTSDAMMRVEEASTEELERLSEHFSEQVGQRRAK